MAIAEKPHLRDALLRSSGLDTMSLVTLPDTLTGLS
jgi:hypothetical protein